MADEPRAFEVGPANSNEDGTCSRMELIKRTGTVGNMKSSKPSRLGKALHRTAVIKVASSVVYPIERHREPEDIA